MNFGDNHDGDGDGDDDGLFFHRNGGYDVNSKIMLTAIISLSVVVLLVLILHIYTRFVLRRQVRRRLQLHQLDLAAGFREAAPPNSAGLDPSVVAALPVFTFGKLKKVATGGEDGGGGAAAECAVCLSVMEEEETALLLPNCNHAFHVGCIDAWLRSNSTCPICRTHAEPVMKLRLQPAESREQQPPVDRSSALPLDRVDSEVSYAGATSSDGTVQSSSINNYKVVGSGSSSSRLSSFRRMLSWERSLRRNQPDGLEDGND